MGYTSLINGHIDEPENGVYCRQCMFSNFEKNNCQGICEVGRMGIVSPNSYCNRGTTKERKTFNAPTVVFVKDMVNCQ